jgi:hypothetical protein
MMSSLDGKIDLFTGTLVDGVLSVDVTVPDDSDLRSWADILPPTATSTVTPDTAQACVINSIIYEDSTNSIEYRTPDATTWVFWAYSDTDAQLTAQGSDLELPGGAYGSMELDLELKKGWNLVTLTRSPETAAKGMSHIDTYSVGDLPDGLKLIYPYQPPL